MMAILPLFSLYYYNYYYYYYYYYDYDYYYYYNNNNVNGFLKTHFVGMKAKLIDNIHFVFYLIGHNIIKSQQN